ncbi:MAG: hypothetical protein JOY71_09985 [Acetobacteraceae bacterium]|nr:hypothetical protein [Acetobacteraceae bacterium]MBV8522435.1 hypothetical protein [Acetobacteraceae bacterium]
MITTAPSPSRSVRALLFSITLLSPALAQAQIMAGSGLGQGDAGAEKPKPPPPAALPGAQTDKARVAPPDRPPGEMSPNEALFDGVNRGDIAAVRDAIDRGADLNAQNVLGLTPVELSIDLGRNDISFLLLSFRSSAAKPGGQPPAPVPERVASKQLRPARPEGRKVAAKQVRARTAESAAPQSPRLFAGDGGTPNTAAGFLGFGAAPAVR